MKKISRTVKRYEYAVYAVTMENGTPVMEELERGVTFEELPKEKAIIAEYRSAHFNERRALVVMIENETEKKYSMSVAKFIREAEMGDNITLTVIDGYGKE